MGHGRKTNDGACFSTHRQIIAPPAAHDNSRAASQLPPCGVFHTTGSKPLPTIIVVRSELGSNLARLP